MNFFWSANEQKMVLSLNSSTKIERYDFVLRDTLPVILRVCNWQAVLNVPYVVTAIDAGKSIKFGAKALATYATDAEFLFSQATWVAAGTGVDTTYSADIQFNTSELIAAMGTASYLDCKAEFTILNASNENELSTQFTVRILKDVITGSEGVPTSEYQVVAQYTDDNGVASVRLVDAEGVVAAILKKGALYPFCASTGLIYPLSVIIQDGIPTLSLGAGEAI